MGIKNKGETNWTLDHPDAYRLPLINNIIQDRGNVAPTFTRSTIATVEDFEGAVHTAKINETRFSGARRVENLLTYSEDFSNVIWDKDYTCTVTGEKIINFPAEDDRIRQTVIRDITVGETFSASVVLSGVADSTLRLVIQRNGLGTTESSYSNIILTATPTKYTVSHTFAYEQTGVRFHIERSAGKTATQVTATDAQLEKATGTQTEASDYVSTNVSVQTGEVTLDDDFGTDTTGDYSINNSSLSYQESSYLRVTSTDTISYGVLRLSILTTNKIYRIRFKAKGTDLYVFKSIGNNTDLESQNVIKNPVLTANWQDYEFVIRATQANCRFYLDDGIVGGYFDIDDIIVEEEYYHGANVDGVEYFNTDRDGAVISDSILKGYLNEPAGTNLALYSSTLENAAWSATNVTKSDDDVLSPDGTLTGATLTATAANGTVIQDLGAIASAIKTYSLWVKRKTGTGDIELTVDGGSTWTAVTVTADWTQVSLSDTLADPDVGIRIVTDTDAIYVWNNQCEASAFVTSNIATAATTVTRTADSLTVSNTTRKVLPNSFAFAGTYTPLGEGDDYENTDVRLFGSQDSREDDYEERTSGGTVNYTIRDGGGFFATDKSLLNQATPNKYALQLIQDGSDVNAKIYKDGVEKISETETQTLDHSNTSLEIGSWAGTVFASNIKDIKIWKRELNNSQLRGVTT